MTPLRPPDLDLDGPPRVAVWSDSLHRWVIGHLQPACPLLRCVTVRRLVAVGNTVWTQGDTA